MFQVSLFPRPSGIVRALLIAAVAVGTACAAPVPIGQVKIAGDAEVTLTTIDYRPFTAGPALDATGMGNVFVTAPGTGVFSPLATPPELGKIRDRTVTGSVAPPVPAQPAGVPILVPNWLTFTNPGFRYALDLTFIEVGTYPTITCFTPAANGQTCTPPAPNPFESPYNLANFTNPLLPGGLSSSASFTASGVLRNLDGGPNFQFVGDFTSVFQGQTFQEVLSIVAAGGSVNPPFTGTIIAFADVQVPEASTGVLALIGIGLFSIGHLRRRKVCVNSESNS